MPHSNLTEALLDGDMLKYEIGFAAESYWKKFHEDLGLEVDPETVPWHIVEDMVDNRVSNILAILGVEKRKAIVFFTGSYNFRFDVTTLFDYKANRADARKPFHFRNIEEYLKSEYTWIQEEGCEADDTMSIWLTQAPETRILVSRDKDMWSKVGWHYSWELGRQPERGPEFVDKHGYLKLNREKKKLIGAGDMWFCAQLLMGDKVDNIPGCRRCGPVRAYDRLKNCKDRIDLMNVVCDEYRACYGSGYEQMLTQVGRCVYLQEKEDELWNIEDWVNG